MITAETQQSLQTQSICSVFLVRHMPNGPEPKAQGLLCVLKNGSRQNRRLKPTFLTMMQVPFGNPRPGTTATRTSKAIWPSQSAQIATAGFFVGKNLFKFYQRPRIILHKEGN
jgi:hypothetical protein